MKNTVICGDCLDVMRDMPAQSIDMVLTSPPYDNLREYNGYAFDFEGIAQEIYRVLKDGGVCVWVVGDATIKGSETGTSFKQALYFKEIGFNLHDTMIYQKQNPIPLTHNRYEQSFEYMFVFSKGRPKTFNPILISTKNPGVISSQKTQKQMSAKRMRNDTVTTKDTKIHSNIFTYSVGSGGTGTHPAPFPESLAENHILSWSNEGDTILDTMAGSGTTLKMAKKNNRNYIGIEISQEYVDIINERINKSS